MLGEGTPWGPGTRRPPGRPGPSKTLLPRRSPSFVLPGGVHVRSSQVQGRRPVAQNWPTEPRAQQHPSVQRALSEGPRRAGNGERDEFPSIAGPVTGESRSNVSVGLASEAQEGEQPGPLSTLSTKSGAVPTGQRGRRCRSGVPAVQARSAGIRPHTLPRSQSLPGYVTLAKALDLPELWFHFLRNAANFLGTERSLHAQRLHAQSWCSPTLRPRLALWLPDTVPPFPP